MNKALIRYLEDRFVQIARECKRYNVLTKNTYSRTVMKEAHIAAMEEFIDNVRVLINALGYKVLEPTVQNTSSSTQDDELEKRISSVVVKSLTFPELKCFFKLISGGRLRYRV